MLDHNSLEGYSATPGLLRDAQHAREAAVHQLASPSARAIIELAMLKLLNATPDLLKREVLPFIEDLQDSKDVELQQRSCEMLRLVRNEDMLEEVMQPMPQYAEAVQQNNPLIARRGPGRRAGGAPGCARQHVRVPSLRDPSGGSTA
ncbi:unnamed protein product [Prorocentrum cordatum]|uniref:Uncharacterized protein n=1 Tax=Prorocentrum cordatum TaxID=2364126 RepID=A0ABN9WZ09_9DINO|nr:unnamed protein product [Polarella glacialis]